MTRKIVKRSTFLKPHKYYIIVRKDIFLFYSISLSISKIFFRRLFLYEVNSQIDVIDGAAVATIKVKCIIHSLDGNYKQWRELSAKVDILISFIPI